jgi:hypothetical protein
MSSSLATNGAPISPNPMSLSTPPYPLSWLFWPGMLLGNATNSSMILMAFYTMLATSIPFTLWSKDKLATLTFMFFLWHLE